MDRIPILSRFYGAFGAVPSHRAGTRSGSGPGAVSLLRGFRSRSEKRIEACRAEAATWSRFYGAFGAVPRWSGSVIVFAGARSRFYGAFGAVPSQVMRDDSVKVSTVSLLRGFRSRSEILLAVQIANGNLSRFYVAFGAVPRCLAQFGSAKVLSVSLLRGFRSRSESLPGRYLQ